MTRKWQNAFRKWTNNRDLGNIEKIFSWRLSPRHGRKVRGVKRYDKREEDIAR